MPFDDSLYLKINLPINITLKFVDLEVSGLTPGKEYLFRVSAVNAEGESKPLEAEEKILAKNPYGTYNLKFSLFSTIIGHCSKTRLNP